MLVDVRDHDEWSAGHAPGAVHAPLSKLKPESFPSDAAIIAVCHSGGRSAKATQRLSATGLSVRNMTGGMSAWADAGLPVTRDDGTPGTVG